VAERTRFKPKLTVEVSRVRAFAFYTYLVQPLIFNP
jgi:hypothetical protein